MAVNNVRAACWWILCGEAMSVSDRTVISGSVRLVVGWRTTFRDMKARLGLQTRRVARGARRYLAGFLLGEKPAKPSPLKTVGRPLRSIQVLLKSGSGAGEMVAFAPRKR